MSSKFKNNWVAAGLLALGLFAAETASAQSGFSEWRPLTVKDGVEVAFATRVSNNEIRVIWRCRNMNSEARDCSIGAGGSKTYNCFQGYSGLGETRMPGERATVQAHSEYIFESDWACRGLGANGLNASAEVSIER